MNGIIVRSQQRANALLRPGAFLLCVFAPFFSTNSFAAQSPLFSIQAAIEGNDLGHLASLRDWKARIQLVKNGPNHGLSLQRATLVAHVFGKNNGEVLGSASRALSSDEILRCTASSGASSCALSSFSLPIALYRVACQASLQVQVPGQGVVTSPSIVPWGLCGDAPTSAFPGRAADLAFDDSLLALDGIRPAPVGVTREPLKQIVVNLGNIGAAPLSRAVDVLAIGYDSTGNIVWEDLSTANATVSFENPVLPYQWHRLCQIRLIADPLDTVFESNKDNNDQSFATGLCESDPALVPTNHPKLVAWVEWSGSQVVGHILNLGRVAAPQPNIPIETRLEVQDSRGQNLLANELFYSQSMIQGYGEEGIVSWTLPSVLPSQTCQVRFTIDPSGQQAGTAFFIHTAQVSHCQ